MKNENQKKQTGRVNYIWVLAGGYLLYLAFKIVKSVLQNSSDAPAVAAVSAVIFAAVGGWLLRREWKAYQYGKAHIDDPESWSDETEELPADAGTEEDGT